MLLRSPTKSGEYLPYIHTTEDDSVSFSRKTSKAEKNLKKEWKMVLILKE